MSGHQYNTYYGLSFGPGYPFNYNDDTFNINKKMGMTFSFDLIIYIFLAKWVSSSVRVGFFWVILTNPWSITCYGFINQFRIFCDLFVPICLNKCFSCSLFDFVLGFLVRFFHLQKILIVNLSYCFSVNVSHIWQYTDTQTSVYTQNLLFKYFLSSILDFGSWLEHSHLQQLPGLPKIVYAIQKIECFTCNYL